MSFVDVLLYTLLFLKPFIGCGMMGLFIKQTDTVPQDNVSLFFKVFLRVENSELVCMDTVLSGEIF